MDTQLKPVHEATLLAQYLLNCVPSEEQIAIYSRATARLESTHDRSLAVALRHPRLMPYFDAYDAFFRPNSLLRQHLLIMFSILETSPDLAQEFLPKERSRWYVIIIGARVMLAGYYLIAGMLLAKVQGL